MSYAITVNGKVDSSDLGITLPHEHLIADVGSAYEDIYRERATTVEYMKRLKSPVKLENLWWMNDREPGPPSLKNHRLDSTNLAIKEINRFKSRGGRTIVDNTSNGLNRDPKALKKISDESGLNVVAGCGYYVSESHPKGMHEKTKDIIADEIINEVENGIGNTEIKPGIIGEVGLSHPFGKFENELTSLKGSAIAQKETGLPISIHPPYFHKESHSILDVMEDYGVNLEDVIVGHMDGTILTDDSVKYHSSLAERGAFVSFDLFGRTGFRPSSGKSFPIDAKRVDHIRKIIEKGFEDKILISQDITHKTHLTEYGGHGYDYILRVIVPLMVQKDFNRSEITNLIENNPMKALSLRD